VSWLVGRLPPTTLARKNPGPAEADEREQRPRAKRGQPRETEHVVREPGNEGDEEDPGNARTPDQVVEAGDDRGVRSTYGRPKRRASRKAT
jgi:hypothetical protein